MNAEVKNMNCGETLLVDGLLWKRNEYGWAAMDSVHIYYFNSNGVMTARERRDKYELAVQRQF